MALIDRNEAGISIVHVLPYTVADLEGAKPAPARPLWASDRRHMHFRVLKMIATNSFIVHQIQRPCWGSLQRSS